MSTINTSKRKPKSKKKPVNIVHELYDNGDNYNATDLKKLLRKLVRKGIMAVAGDNPEYMDDLTPTERTWAIENYQLEQAKLKSKANSIARKLVP